jgi:hypothetical protein
MSNSDELSNSDESSCPFKNIFGKPKTGPHSLRIADIAVVDTSLTVLGAFLISKYFKQPFLPSLLFFFLLGELLHWIFCVDTTVILKIKELLK